MTFKCPYDFDKPTPGFQYLLMENTGLCLCEIVSTFHNPVAYSVGSINLRPH